MATYEATAYPMKRLTPHVSAVDEPATEKSNRDEIELARFGKKQQLKRRFGLLSIVSLTCTLMITWEGSLTVFAGGLLNGGPAGLIYGFLFVWIGNFLQALVMGELASMMPLAGGQYNWVAILAPPRARKFLSYMTGWITVISWQAAIASAAYFGGAMIQGLLVLTQGDGYNYQRWHGTLLFYAVLCLSVFINTVCVRVLPHIESMVFVIHVIGYFAILIPMVHFAPHGTAREVFATFTNGGLWPQDGLSFFIGLIPAMYTFIGLDAAGHMAEEIKDASTVIPESMLWSVGINGAMGISMIIAVLFCIGNAEEVLGTDTGFPYIQIFYNSTQSIGGTVAMSSLVIAAFIFAAIGVLATGSRMTWAFARERGLPGSEIIGRVEPRTGLPMYAILVSVVTSLILALINIGSSTAFNALTSLVIAAFYSSYSLAAGVLLHKRLTVPAEEMCYGPFTLGKWGVPIIVASLVYSLIGTFFSFWPPTVNPTAETMNWSVLVFGVAVLFSLFFYVVQGRKVYTGPIMEIDDQQQR